MASLAANLALNAVWSWMFFGLRSPRAGLAGTVLLDISNAGLIRRTARTDSPGRGGAGAVRAVMRVRHRTERRHRTPQ